MVEGRKEAGGAQNPCNLTRSEREEMERDAGLNTLKESKTKIMMLERANRRVLFWSNKGPIPRDGRNDVRYSSAHRRFLKHMAF